jgi:glycopeptide antibiotics resistance protein
MQNPKERGKQQMKSNECKALKKYVKVILFGLYSLIMLYLLLGRKSLITKYYWTMVQGSINLVPFHTVQEFVNTLHTSSSTYLIRHSFINLAGNVVMFIPYGFFLPWIFERCKKYNRTVIYSGTTIVLIEIIQLFSLRGSFDVDDLILNLVGVSLGYALFMLIAKSIARKREDR